MEKVAALGNIEKISRQRNLFLILTILISCMGLGLTLKLLQIEEKIILVPGLSQEVWVKGGEVSKGYLEETTLMYLPLLLDLSPEIVNYKAGIIFKYISQGHPLYMKKIQDYFADAKNKYTKFALSTYFAVKNLEVNSRRLEVIANGILTSRYGERGFKIIPASYQLTYDWLGGRLRLKEFVKVRDEKEKQELKNNFETEESEADETIEGGE